MFRIKICGIKTIKDAEMVSNSGADAVGLNFFPPSIRYLDPTNPDTSAVSERAAQLSLLRVGVIVNLEITQAEQLLEQVSLDALQLHGHEAPETAQNWISLGVPIIKAIKLPTGPISTSVIDQYCLPWIEAGCHPLFDAEAGNAHGGVGARVDWESVGKWSKSVPSQNFTLAGGLTPENAAEAIAQTGAQSVDAASGVENPRGTKNEHSLQRFVEACSLR